MQQTAPLTKEQRIMAFLYERVFNPVLTPPKASARLKQGIRQTVIRLQQRNAAGMIHFFWSAIIGTERSTRFAAMMRAEGFDRFEETIDDFRAKFT